MTKLRIERCRAVVQVICEPAEADWIASRSAPYFKAREAAPETGWTVYAGFDAAPAAEDYDLQEWRYPSGEFSRTHVSCTQQAMVIDMAPGSWRRLYLLRAVRSLLRWQLQAKHLLYLHGAAVARRSDGAALCIVGRSRTGKSVLSYNLLRSGRWSFVSQDDLCLAPGRGGDWTILGWPGALRLRREALDLFPELAAHEGRLTHPANGLERDLPPHQGLLRIFPEELSELHGAGVRGEASLDAVVVLDPDASDAALSRLSPAQAREQLRAAHDVLPERRAGVRAEDARLDRRPWSDLPYNPQLLTAFGLPDMCELDARRSALASSVPVWRAGRSALAIPHGLDRLLDLARLGRSLRA